ncbi:MAG TPA: dCTP deaminase, partial [Gemmataceae bacterium]|nr:dCTP deaminase [Gemmataceae bacterium]
MILCDHHIEKAATDGWLGIDPPLDPANLESSALNLRVGDDFRRWNEDLRAPASKHLIDIDNINLSDLIGLTIPLEPNGGGLIVIPPGGFVLVRTLEHIDLPIKGKLAARVEGRSKQARLGMTAHITAPTIHAGFRGKIVLEILNHGPFHLEIRPNQSKLCQLVFEKVSGV